MNLALRMMAAMIVIGSAAGALAGPEAAGAIPETPPASQPDVTLVYYHNADYTSVVGELIWRDLEGGFWQLNYLPPNSRAAAADPHGGHFVLGKLPNFKGLNSGDWVRVTGQISANQISIFMAGTMYQAKTVQPFACKVDNAPASQPNVRTAPNGGWLPVDGNGDEYRSADGEERVFTGWLRIKEEVLPDVPISPKLNGAAVLPGYEHRPRRVIRSYELIGPRAVAWLYVSSESQPVLDKLGGAQVQIKGKGAMQPGFSADNLIHVGWVRPVAATTCPTGLSLEAGRLSVHN